MAAMFTDDPNELNNRYMPKDNGMYEDDEEYIPEEELTEEERESLKMVEGWTEETWQTIRSWLMDEEDYTLSEEEFGAKNVLTTLNSTTLNLPKDMIYPHKLWLAKSLYSDQAFHVVERLKKKPEEGANIPPEILDIIYTKAKEYKG
jgi:hypothetical protein